MMAYMNEIAPGYTLEQHKALARIQEELRELYRECGDAENAGEAAKSANWHRNQIELMEHEQNG